MVAKWTVGCIAAAVLLAGCSSPGKDNMDPTSVPVDAVTLAVIIVQFNATTLPMPTSVDVETMVNVTFIGSDSTGTGGLYLWDFGDGGKATTVNATHAFAQAGAFNVTLTVGIGANESMAAVLFNVTAPAPSLPSLIATGPFSFAGNLPLGNPNSPMNPGVDYNDHAVTIPATLEDGRPVVAKEVRITLDGAGATAHSALIYWRDAAGTNLGTAGSIPGGLDQTLTYSETMAPGEYVVRVRLALGANMDYTVTGDIDYYDF